jgi:hypothetical protein
MWAQQHRSFPANSPRYAALVEEVPNLIVAELALSVADTLIDGGDGRTVLAENPGW